MTVKELLAVLQTHDPDAVVRSTGADEEDGAALVTESVYVLAANGRVLISGLWRAGNMRKLLKD